MRVIADIATDRILQVTTTPEDNGLTTVNGRYIVPIPDGVAVEVTPTSYIFPQDANSIPGLAASGLLARYPMYDHVLYNFLLEDSDLANLEPSPTPPPDPPDHVVTTGRFQCGRSGGSPSGLAPNSVAILPGNRYKTPYAPGLLQFGYSLASYNADGAREFLVWWKIAKMSVSEDIVSGYELTAGTNEPSLKTYDEFEQEPEGLIVYLSNDNGTTWTEVNRLEPLDVGQEGTLLQLAFLNTGSEKIYLTAFAVLFSDP